MKEQTYSGKNKKHVDQLFFLFYWSIILFPVRQWSVTFSSKHSKVQVDVLEG